MSAGCSKHRARPMGGRRVRAIVFGFAAVLFHAAVAFALINPNFTPVQLVEQSDTILYVEAGSPGDDGSIPIKILKTVKGEATTTPPTVLTVSDTLADRLKEGVYYEDRSTVRGLIFETREAGALNLDGHWFALEKAEKPGVRRLTEDPADMKSVWDGRTDMLLACVEYVLSDPDPQVPVRAGVRWAAKKAVGKVGGRCAEILAVGLSGDGRPSLFVLSEAGDRAFRYEAGKNAFEEQTALLKLRTRSRAAAFADLNADGRLDLASWDGKRLVLVGQSDKGVFEIGLADLQLDGDCIGLAPIDVGIPGHAGFVISTTGDPKLIRMQEDEWRISDLVPPLKDKPQGAARPCLVADFDGDGRPDILQPFEEGAILYRGLATGEFAAPTSCGDLYSGQGSARSVTGDFDADGRLDAAFMGDAGLYMWRNIGGGRFEENLHLGEPDYIAKEGASGGAVGDFNNDGRQDFLMLYKSAAPHLFFSRGFSTFGFAGELDVMKDDFFRESGAGQQAGVLADLNGDGAQDLAVVLSHGTVWALLRAVENGRSLCLLAALSPASGNAGPLSVTGWDEERCLGVWNVIPGACEAFFGTVDPGPIRLRWRFPGGPLREKQVVVERAPVRISLPSGQ